MDRTGEVLTASQAPEQGKIDCIPGTPLFVLPFRGFEDHGYAGEFGVVHKGCETGGGKGGWGGIATDCAAAEVLVAVELGAGFAFGVVEVHGAEVGEAADLVELLEGGIGGRLGAHVVAGGVHVAGIEAEADAGGFCGFVDGGGADLGELFELAPELRAGPDGSFEADDGAETLGAFEEFAVGRGDAGDAFCCIEVVYAPGW